MDPRRPHWLSIVAEPAVYALVLLLGRQLAAQDEGWRKPQTVVVRDGDVRLNALLWRPSGAGVFPAVLISHGSGRTPEELQRLGPYERQAESIGPVFAKHGYVVLYLFRRGVGLSADQGVSSVDLMNREAAQHGAHARNLLQMELLENREANDVRAALEFLRTQPEVDPRDIALIGDSFGSSLTLLVAEREPSMRAVVVFATAGFRPGDRSKPGRRTRFSLQWSINLGERCIRVPRSIHPTLTRHLLFSVMGSMWEPIPS